MKSINRLRQQIIDLNTGKVYLNRSMIEKDIGISRYHIDKSLKENIPIKDQMFAYYSYGMNIDDVIKIYMQNNHNKIINSKKYKKMTELKGEKLYD